jgi:hypothetical protein
LSLCHIRLPLAVDTHSAALILLRAVQEAHLAVIDGVEHSWEAGATAILGGLILPVARTDENGGHQYIFLSISVRIIEATSADRFVLVFC